MGKYVLAAVLVSSLLTLFLLPVRKGLRRFVGSIGVYALWLFVAISPVSYTHLTLPTNSRV